ncbi:methionine ABC transporter permease [Nicoliella lavandulae]|uniref:Methionine ABC transporter permease n=1 Tax=Nicoliella lavandulae TaxID=3082954 RepID=A0ABU8SJ13_9LACO
MLSKYFPNVASNWTAFTQSIIETLEMVVISGIIAFVISLFLGILLVVTQPDGIAPNRVVWNIVDKLINLFRSIPFIILIVALIPLTTAISGTAIGVKGTIFPLVIGITPFFARQVESALNDTDDGLIETGEAIGLTNLQIIRAIYLHESVAGLTRMTTTTIVSLVGLTAIVGVVGGGGLGNFAIQYGYQQNQFDVTLACIIVLLIIVTIVQILGTLISEILSH